MGKHSRYMINSTAMPYVTLLCKNDSPYPSAYLVAWQRQLGPYFLIKKPKLDYHSDQSKILALYKALPETETTRVLNNRPEKKLLLITQTKFELKF
jgi:hypothetical protein